MKRIFSFVLPALLAVVFTTAHAQQNIFIWKGGDISVKSAADIDSISTSVGWLFDIRTSAATSVTTNTLKASISVSYADNVRSLSPTPEIGVCFSSDKATPTYADEHSYLGTSDGSYDFTLSYLEPGTTYYYRGYVKLGAEVFYGNVKSIMTYGEKPYILINGHWFIDLGLPSGLLWAESNVGASSFSDDGDYFAWGETKSKSYYDWNTYKWGNNYNNLFKYNSSDGKTTLDSEDDAATVNWGAPCRMPDPSELVELKNECDWFWQPNFEGTGTSGYLVVGPNNYCIFLPASGYRNDDDTYYHGWTGYYWSRSLESGNTGAPRSLRFRNGFVSPWDDDTWCMQGLTVRPVAER